MDLILSKVILPFLPFCLLGAIGDCCFYFTIDLTILVVESMNTFFIFVLLANKYLGKTLWTFELEQAGFIDAFYP